MARCKLTNQFDHHLIFIYIGESFIFYFYLIFFLFFFFSLFFLFFFTLWSSYPSWKSNRINRKTTKVHTYTHAYVIVRIISKIRFPMYFICLLLTSQVDRKECRWSYLALIVISYEYIHNCFKDRSNLHFCLFVPWINFEIIACVLAIRWKMILRYVIFVAIAHGRQYGVYDDRFLYIYIHTLYIYIYIFQLQG